MHGQHQQRDTPMNETRSERTLRQLNAIGATVTKCGAVYEIRFKDEHIKTTDLGIMTQGDILMLQGRYATERQCMISKKAARKASGRDW